MMRRLGSALRRLLRDRRGSVLVIGTASLPVIAATTALGVDFGYVLYAQNRLQASTDAAALAGAQGLYDGTYQTKAELFSSSAAAGGLNVIDGVTVSSPTISARCSTTIQGAGVACSGGSNVIEVNQTGQAPLYFGSALGLSSVTISAYSFAAAAGAGLPNLNVMIILDTTASMSQSDSKCLVSGRAVSKLACAELGVQSVLSQLYPSIDYVGLEVFPGLNASSAQYDVSGCSSHTISSSNLAEYGSSGFSANPATATYQIVAPSTCTSGVGGTCYRTSNIATTLNTSSPLVETVGSSATHAGCLQAPGGMGTYYSDAITAAQTELAAFKTSLGAAGANSQNAIVILSDGDASASSSGRSPQIVSSEASQQCHEAITAATTAKNAGTWIYAIAYQSPTSGGCSTDTNPAITPYCALLEIASTPTAKFFYSDTTPPTAACPNGVRGPAASSNVANIFQNIGLGLSQVRLIPQQAYSN